MSGSGIPFGNKGELVALAELAQAAYGNAAPASTGITWLKDSDLRSIAPQLSDGLYVNQNAAALVGRSGDALVIAFRGTDEPGGIFTDSPDWNDNEAKLVPHYAKMEPLVDAALAYAGANNLGRIYLTGHSLGAGMVQAVLEEFPADQRFRALLLANPGFSNATDDRLDPRAAAILVDGDAIDDSDFLLPRIEPSILIDVTNSAGDVRHDGRTLHEVDLYVEFARFLEARGFTILDFLGRDGQGFPRNVSVDAQRLGPANWVVGTANDTLSASPGNDSLFGGAGLDTAVFDGDFCDYEITRTGDVLTIRDDRFLSGTWFGDGTDTLREIEFLRFADRTVAVANLANEKKCDDDPDPPAPTPPPTWLPPNNPLTMVFVDPLVFDLDRDGAIELLPLARGIRFDIDIDDIAEAIGWVHPQDALLVLDRNGNGLIDSAAELYGNAAEDGFTVLARDDSNADGVMDGRDSVFRQLRLWRDLDSDGVTDAGELSTLASHGITAIALRHQPAWQVVEGNRILMEGAATLGNSGQSMRIGAVFFATDQTLSSATPPAGFQFNQAALLLPTLRGFGDLRDLWASMTSDPALRQSMLTLVQQSDTLSFAELRQRFEGILFQWAGVHTLAPDSRGGAVDARVLGFLEELHGIVFTGGRGVQSNPNSAMAPRFLELFDNVADVMFAHVAAQLPMSFLANQGTLAELEASPLRALAEAFSFDLTTNRASADLPLFFELLAERAPSEAAAARRYWEGAAPVLQGLRLEQFNGDAQAFATAIEAAATPVLPGIFLRSLVVELAAGTNRVLGSDAASREWLGGSSGRDLFLGGRGPDHMQGREGSDTYVFEVGDGQDTIADWDWGGAAQDRVLFGPGFTPAGITVTQAQGGAALVFTQGADSLTIENAVTQAATVVERFIFADGTVWTHAEALRRSFAGSAGSEPITGDDQANALSAGAGQDTLRGLAGDDTLTGGTGNDWLFGGEGSDTYLIALGDGPDTISESQAWNNTTDRDVVSFGAGISAARVTATQSGSSLVLTLGSPGQTLTLANAITDPAARIESFRFADGTQRSFEQMLALAHLGTSGAERIRGDSAANDLKGMGGHDSLSGMAGADSLTGGTGDDLLEGGEGSDTYHIALRDGRDVIRETQAWGNTTDRDTVIFGAGITLGALRVTQANAGQDLVLTLGSSAQTLTLPYSILHSAHRVETFRFADGASRSFEQLLALSLTGTTAADHLRGSDLAERLAGDAGHDTLRAGAGRDTLEGGAGNDSLEGGEGSDVYLIAPGGNHDTIRETQAWNNTTDRDTLSFQAGITLAQLTVRQSGDDLVLNIGGAAQSVTLRGAIAAPAARIETVSFADGTSRSHNQIWLMSLTGGDGNDRIEGNSAANALLGQAGRDTLLGGAGNDTLTGGAGNDSLEGGAGSDTYFIALGDGQDVILETASTTDRDTLTFGAGITLATLAVAQSASANDLILTIGTQGQVVTLRGVLSNPTSRIESFRFTDGTVLTHEQLAALAGGGTPGPDNLRGTEGHNSLSGAAGKDTLQGLGGNDTLHGGPGDDRLEGGGGSDTYAIDLGDGRDVIIEAQTSGNTTDRDLVSFAAGITLAGLTVSQSSSGADLLISIGTGGQSLTLRGAMSSQEGRVETFLFADGTRRSFDQMAALSHAGSAANDRIAGDKAANALSGQAGQDSLQGLAGADTLNGGNGDDLLEGGEGSDTYMIHAGDGRDVIREVQSGTNTTDRDIINFGSSITLAGLSVTQASSGHDLVLAIGAGGQSLTLRGAVTDIRAQVESFRFADGAMRSFDQMLALSFGGTSGHDRLHGNAASNAISGATGNDLLIGLAGNDTLDGGEGQDTLRGEAGHDSLRGGLGHDLLEGGEGSDVYAIALGDGRDVIQESQASGNTTDRDQLVFGAGISLGQISVTQAGGGRDLVLFLGGSEQSVTLRAAVADARAEVESFRFADGTSRSFDQMLALSYGGTAGHDHLKGDAGANRLSGLAGHDTLEGGDGNDTMAGGTGNDFLAGGSGSDTYLIHAREGADVITESRAWNNTTDRDTLIFGAGIAPTQIITRFENSGRDVVLTVAGTSQSVTLRGAGTDPAARIETYRFADGTLRNHEQITAGNVFITANAAALAEGQAGGTAFSFTLTRFGHTQAPHTVDWQVTGSGASPANAADFLGNALPAGSVTFAAGETLRRLTVTVAGDTLAEPDEGFTLTLTPGGPGVVIWGGGATQHIRSEEIPLTRGTAGADSVTGTAARNHLDGREGHDTLSGGDGDDTLEGGAGADRLTGGAGADHFRFAALADLPAGSRLDNVLDFRGPEGDRLDIAALDANPALPGDQAFVFIGNAAFTAPGQARFEPGLLQLNTDQDSEAEAGLVLTGVAVFQADWLLG